MAEKDNMKVNTSPVADVETGTAEDVEAIMKKYDRESNTRIWEGAPKQVIRYLLAAFSLLMLYMNLFANWDERVRRALFVGVVIILSFLIYPMKKGSTKKNSIPIYDIILMVLGAGAYFYFVINFKTIIGHATRISQTEVIVGVIGILILGGTWGNLADLYSVAFPFPGNVVLAVCGISIGIFVGCLVKALAETLKALPVLNRRSVWREHWVPYR